MKNQRENTEMAYSVTNQELTVCITGDIDHFELENDACMEHFFQVLDRHDIKSENFVALKAAMQYPSRMAFIIKSGHVLAGHGDVHEAFYDPLDVQTARLKKMAKSFFENFGVVIKGFRAPWYKHNTDTYQAVDNAGLEYDCSKKRSEIAFERVPYFEKKYMFCKPYTVFRPFLKLVGSAYNLYSKSPRYPYKITPNMVEFPTLGISDYSLIDAPEGPQFQPEDCPRIAEIWTECLRTLKSRGGGVITLQAHPGRLSPAYMPAVERFIENALAMNARFSTPRDISKRF